MMKRRTFLKIIAGSTVAGALPLTGSEPVQSKSCAREVLYHLWLDGTGIGTLPHFDIYPWDKFFMYAEKSQTEGYWRPTAITEEEWLPVGKGLWPENGIIEVFPSNAVAKLQWITVKDERRLDRVFFKLMEVASMAFVTPYMTYFHDSSYNDDCHLDRGEWISGSKEWSRSLRPLSLNQRMLEAVKTVTSKSKCNAKQMIVHPDHANEVEKQLCSSKYGEDINLLVSDGCSKEYGYVAVEPEFLGVLAEESKERRLADGSKETFLTGRIAMGVTNPKGVVGFFTGKIDGVG